MKQLIDKDALVAEIEKLKLCTMDEHMNFYSAEAQGEYNALSKLESLLDAPKVKEVDLDNELDFVKDAYYYFTSDERGSMKKVATHFFELGLKVAQKGEL